MAASEPRSLAGSNQSSAEVLARISSPSAYPLPRGPSVGGEHTHAVLDASAFSVRGANYLRDGLKQPSSPAVLDLMHVDMFRCEQKIGNVAARSDSWLRQARAAGDTRYYLTVLYVTTASPYIHLVLYFAVQPERARANPSFAGLWARFTAEGAEGDAFRNARWKVIPSVSEGPWAVKYAVGTKPALLGTKLSHTWVLNNNGGGAPLGAGEGGGGGGGGSSGGGSGGGGGGGGGEGKAGLASPARRGRSTSFSSVHGPGPYLEADCDVASSSMALILVSLLQGSAKCVVGLAFFCC